MTNKSSPENARNGRILSTVAKIAFAAIILTLLVKSGRLDFKSIWSAVSFFSVTGMAIAIGTGYLLSAERFRSLLLVFQTRLTFAQSLQLFFTGLFFNFILPGGVGGDVVKAYYIHRGSQTNSHNSTLAVIVDRLLGLYTMIMIAAVMIVYDMEHLRAAPALYRLSMIILAVAISTTTVGVLLFSVDISTIMKIIKKYFPRKKYSILRSIPTLVEMFFKSPKIVLRSFALSVCAQLLFMGSLAIAGDALGYGHLDMMTYLLIGSLGFLLSALPLTPAGIGIGQAAFLFVVNAYLGNKTNFGSSIVTFYQGVTLIWGLVGGVVYLLSGARQISPALERQELELNS